MQLLLFLTTPEKQFPRLKKRQSTFHSLSALFLFCFSYAVAYLARSILIAPVAGPNHLCAVCYFLTRSNNIKQVRKSSLSQTKKCLLLSRAACAVGEKERKVKYEAAAFASICRAFHPSTQRRETNKIL